MLISVASGIAVCRLRSGRLLLALRKEIIDHCRLIVVVAVDGGVGVGDIGGCIVGDECLRGCFF